MSESANLSDLSSYERLLVSRGEQILIDDAMRQVVDAIPVIKGYELKNGEAVFLFAKPVVIKSPAMLSTSYHILGFGNTVEQSVVDGWIEVLRRSIKVVGGDND